MAYKFEVEQKTKAVKVRVLIAVYVMFVISAILIGVAVRLQQLQSVRPTRPSADTAGNPAAAAVSQASDPTYNVRQLGALAYCEVVDSTGQTTGEKLPLAARFTFKQVRRDVGQFGTELGAVCSAATGGACNWKTANNPAARCLDGQTSGQCNPADFYACEDNAVPGALFYSQAIKDSTVSSPLVTWPGALSLSNLIYDDNEVDVILNQDAGDLAGNTITRNGVTYTINKSSLATVDTSSIFPIYNWRCNNDICTTGNCQNGSLSYQDSLCTFNSTSRLFNCPANKYVRYNVLSDHKTYYYNLSNKAGQVGSDASWVKMGYAYETLADASYQSAMPSEGANVLNFKGNVAKFKYTCTAPTTTTTPTPTPSTIISARKVGPVCVERVEPNNEATFTITVSNNGTAPSVIEKVEDALPQGFSYKANSTRINGNVVSDSYVTTVNSGSSQKVTFSPPSGQPSWSLAQGQTLTIVLTTVASTTAVTGVNTNRVVVTPEGTDAIDNITYQFEVSQTCNPVTGIFDQPILVFAVSGIFILLGGYLLYAPSGSKILEKLNGIGTQLEKKVVATGKKLKDKADEKKRFESKLLKRKK
ncbi:DUF11 domain-containing protein [bacterium]|nr:DUF11 domain-containing protein [bacterium]